MSRAVLRLAALAALAVCFLAGCGAVFPRYTAASRLPPPGMLEATHLPAPPSTVQRIAVLEAEVPPHRRDGSPWDPDGPPDLFAVLYRDDREVYRTPVVRDSVHPVWTDAAVTLYVTPASRLRFELWDEDGVFDDIVGRAESLGVPTTAMNGGEWLVRLESGVTLHLAATAPPPRLGLGITYEVHDDYLRVLEVEASSPAARAGLRAGDHVTAIDGRSVSDLGETGARDAIYRAALRDVDVTVVHAAGAAAQVHVPLGAVYPAL